MVYGKLSTPAPTIAVILWIAEYHQVAVRDDINSFSVLVLSASLSANSCKMIKPQTRLNKGMHE